MGVLLRRAPPSGPLHTGTDGVIYDSANEPVRLVGFNWTGTESGGRSDHLKTADVCGVSWRVPTDRIGDLPFNYDNLYQDIRDSGYNVIRIPVSWNNLEPGAPVWDDASSGYEHSWNDTYLNDLKSMVSRARAAGLMVILDMHQDYWSPALHNITNWDGSRGYCEGVGMPRWLYPTMDAKASTTQNVDFYNGMNWFFRNIHDPLATVTRATPWQLFYASWDFLAHQFSAASGFADYQAVVAADLFNEPYVSYLGGSPPAGQTVLQAAGTRLLDFYNAIAPAVTAHNPSWLLLFQDCTGGYNTASPSSRETPTITAKPSVPGNWVYSVHLYNFAFGTFSDGVPRHDDFGLTLANVVLANAQSWRVPLLIGEFTSFTLGVDARQLTDADMEQTLLFLNWAREHGVSWTFWSYVNPYRPMTVVDYTTNQTIPVVKRALDAGLGTPNTNQAPSASFTSTCEQLVCAVDGSSSGDPDGSVVVYDWTFGDGGRATGATPSHAYMVPGTYTVTLTVTDNDGATDSVTHDVVAVAAPVNQAPEAAFNYTSSGLQVAFNGSSSGDPDGSVVGYDWTFGDGGRATGATPSHAYMVPGTYTVTLTVTDNDGATDSVTHDVVAVAAPVNQAPEAAFNYTSSGLQVAFNGSSSGDPDGSVVGYDWTFGDGGRATGANPSHAYMVPGTYTVTLTVTDNDGATDSIVHDVGAVGPTPTPTPVIPTPTPAPVVPTPVPAVVTPAPAGSVTPTPVSGPAAVVKVKSVKMKSKLYVNVNPNKGKRYWKFKVQKQRASGSWKSLKTYRTKGKKETRTINLKKGTYRVKVKPKYGYQGVTSRSVHLTR